MVCVNAVNNKTMAKKKSVSHPLSPLGYDGVSEIKDFLVQFGYDESEHSEAEFCLSVWGIELPVVSES